MTNDALPTSAGEVAPTLTKVSDRLATGSINQEEADAALDVILATESMWEGYPPEHVTGLRDS